MIGVGLGVGIVVRYGVKDGVGVPAEIMVRLGIRVKVDLLSEVYCPPQKKEKEDTFDIRQ